MIRNDLVLALYPSVRSCGYVLFEGALSPFDFGLVLSQRDRVLALVKRLASLYELKSIVVEDWYDTAYRRVKRIVRLYESLHELVEKLDIRLIKIRMRDVREHFNQRNALTKHAIAEHIAKLMPAFSYQLPSVRRPWDAQSRRQALYDAAAIGSVYFSKFAGA